MSKPAGEKSAEGPKIEGPKGETPKPDAAAAGLSAEQLANIRQLPADEQKLAISQKVCPVSGDPLGGEMGKPYKVTYEGRTFFLCCKSCEKDVRADPKAIIAKLDKK
jgi:hypothetical protein